MGSIGTRQQWRAGAWLIGLFISPLFLRAETTGLEYRGFSIDDSRVRDLANIKAVRTATEEQIDIVCAVGLPPEILAFFQSVPFILVPPGTFSMPTPGLYDARTKSVRVAAGIVRVGHKPVLLHELLHAFHDQRLDGGFGNRTILGYFEEARTITAFAANSHMMENNREFFACSATTYLFGVTAQEPFERDKIKENQPEFFAYLKNLFGPNAGNYLGSLTR